MNLKHYHLNSSGLFIRWRGGTRVWRQLWTQDFNHTIQVLRKCGYTQVF